MGLREVREGGSPARRQAKARASALSLRVDFKCVGVLPVLVRSDALVDTRDRRRCSSAVAGVRGMLARDVFLTTAWTAAAPVNFSRSSAASGRRWLSMIQ